MNLQSLINEASSEIALIWLNLKQLSTLIQLGIIFSGVILSRLLSRFVEPQLEKWARSIRGNPDLLRMLAALMRRTEWLVFIILMWLSIQCVSLYSKFASRTYFLNMAMQLATAWLAIAVLSRAIRSRPAARVIAFLGWSWLALSLTGLLGPFLEALNSLAINLGNFRLSLLSLLQAVLVVAVMSWLATIVGNFVEVRVSRVEELTPSLRVLIGKVTKITLVLLAILIGLTAVGIDISAFTFFSGAIGVGIGFGLQKVVSNFISGIIILLDKSIKPGDTISLGETFGWIRELRARFVSVVTRDGREFLIPNEDLITQQVVNWSFTDKLIRLDLHFGVSYDSDPHEVSRLAIDACQSVGRVYDGKSPVCWMTAFGDSSLDFVLRFWIVDPQNGLTNIRGKVFLALWDTFKEHKIDIPFPHREIIMRTPVEVASAPDTGARPVQAKLEDGNRPMGVKD